MVAPRSRLHDQDLPVQCSPGASASSFLIGTLTRDSLYTFVGAADTFDAFLTLLILLLLWCF